MATQVRSGWFGNDETELSLAAGPVFVLEFRLMLVLRRGEARMRKSPLSLHYYRKESLKLQALFVPTLIRLTNGRPAAFQKTIPVKLSINDRCRFVKYKIFYKSSEIVI
jgi:hypothetical protein